jgi:SAM-dependent methyltransferase
VRVLATDAAPAMLAATRRKAAAAGLYDHIAVAPLDLTALASAPAPALPFDGALANFGVLNCLPDRRPVAAALARWVRPGGHVVLVVMGPCCPWEIGWHLAHGQARTAGRRFRAGGTAHVGNGARMRVWYPSPRRLRADLAPAFRLVRTAGIGVLLPPSYLSHLVERWPRVFERLARLERRLGGVYPCTWLNDHYLMIFERL